MPLLLLLPPSTSPPTSSGGWGTGGWGSGFWGGGGAGGIDDGALKNLSFEDAGDEAGEAEFWSSFAYDPAGDYAAWDALYGSEDFETWATDNSPLTDAVTEAAGFEILEDGGTGVTAPLESMDSGWPGTDTFTSEVENSEDAAFGDDAQPYDGFENSWLSAPFVEEVLSSTSAPDEDFESGWGNDAYITDATAPPAGPLTTAQFGNSSASVGFENFESVRPAVMASADAANNQLRVASHPFAGPLYLNRVQLEFTGLPPEGLQELHDYYVNVVSDTILELVEPGDISPVDITSDGAGTIKIVADPSAYWSDTLD